MDKQSKFFARLKASSAAYGGVIHFERMRGEAAKHLLDIGAANAKDRQNDAPTFGAIVKFLLENPSFKGIGYIVLPEREDERISLEGVRGYFPSEQEIKNYKRLFKKADEFECPTYQEGQEGAEFRAWFD